MKLCIAGVCLLNKPYHTDGIYDYKIPDELQDCIMPGMFVTVPFGMSNAPSIGVVWELKETSEYPRIKTIQSVCPDNVSLDGEMMGLCTFMRQRTLCTTGDAVRAMVPSSALSKLCELYTVNPEYNLTQSDELSSSDLFIYEYVREHGKTPVSVLRHQFGAGTETSLRFLRSRRYLLRSVEWKDQTAEKLDTVWSLAIPEGEARLLCDGARVGEWKLTSQKHKNILSVLLQEQEPMATAVLSERSDAGYTQLKALLQKGILVKQTVRVDRNPYAFEKVSNRELFLNEEQTRAVETLWSLASSGEAKAALLHGVTGSGKTCVMLSLIDRILKNGRGVIVLLPEIALTPQSVSIFCSHFGDRVAVIHSALSAGERYDAYTRIREGRADVVLGTRSAVFAPVQNLGAIIIDEEQEHTYKSDQNPKYHARDIARFRCHHHNALMLLASATPSLESYKKAKDGIYTLVRLTERFGNAKLPKVEIADMRQEIQTGNVAPLGQKLLESLCETVSKKEQAVLFLNRRGYNHFVSCRTCGQAVTCPSCSVAMTYHTNQGTYAEGNLVCHWCGRRMPMPHECPSCSSPHLARMGFGTQRVEEELQNLLPDSKILRMDTDTTSTKFAYDEMLQRFREHRADILLGTQMVTKGHDFPHVTLVGVLLADASLYLDDYRASERTFAMLTQVIGRAGRGELAGRAVIQTNNPDSEIIRLACAQDYESFYEREIRLRQLLVFPPFCDIALLTLSGEAESEVFRASVALSERVENMTKGDYTDVALVTFGPFEAPVYRVDNRYRMRMVVKCKLTKRTLAMFSEILCAFGQNGSKRISLSIDLNPSNL